MSIAIKTRNFFPHFCFAPQYKKQERSILSATKVLEFYLNRFFFRINFANLHSWFFLYKYFSPLLYFTTLKGSIYFCDLKYAGFIFIKWFYSVRNVLGGFLWNLFIYHCINLLRIYTPASGDSVSKIKNCLHISHIFL